MIPSFSTGAPFKEAIIMNTSTESTDPYPFEDFAPTLSQCFVLVIVGYLLSKLEILTASDVKGVISLANYFAMPGIICVSLMDADFSDFRWELLFGIFLGKFFTFVVVAAYWITLKSNIGVAAVLALFCTQSNDLPVGNPLMSALYNDYRPQMMKYLFLIPAMTVVLFVPISNIMLSIHREKTKEIMLDDLSLGKYWWKCVRKEDILNQVQGIAKHPVIIATVGGLVLNFALTEGAPDVLRQPIKVAAATIPGIALLMLGFSFVRKERFLLSAAVIPAAVLFVFKMVITPVLLHAVLTMLTKESQSSKLLSDFALLYGIISPATTVFLSGQEFRKALAVMSVALILSSFACFPVSYVVARATIAPVHKLNSYVPILKIILFWTACVSICCDVITGFIVTWRNQRQQASSYILYLLFTQIITCCGLIMWSVTERQTWTIFCEMALYYGGEISGYLWTGTLAVVLVFKHKNWAFSKQGFFFILCMAFSVSAIATTVMCLLMLCNATPSVYVVASVRSNFEFLQLTVTSIFLFINLLIAAGCLTHHFKSNKKTDDKNGEARAYDNTAFYVENHEDIVQPGSSKELIWAEKAQERLGGKDETCVHREEISNDREFECSPSVQEREWTFRLSSLLVLLSLTMLVRLVANVFKLLRSQTLEVMIPMEFLQSTLFIGQGIFILLTFGIDVRTIVIILRKWCRKITHREDKDAARIKELNSKDAGQIGLFCDHFCKFYYSRCFSDIAKERQWMNTVYKNSFWGHQLVDWLISEGLCQDDVDAESQGQKLLEGNVIQHVSQKHHFYDAPYLYQFVIRNIDNVTTKNSTRF